MGDLNKFFTDKNLILASNRGPVEFYKEDNEIKSQLGSGGLVSTLKPLMEQVKCTWIAATINPLDNKIATQYQTNNIPLTGNNPDFHVEFLTINPKEYDEYYNVISNSILWYIHHYIWKPPEDKKVYKKIYNSWKNGYNLLIKNLQKKL